MSAMGGKRTFGALAAMRGTLDKEPIMRVMFVIASIALASAAPAYADPIQDDVLKAVTGFYRAFNSHNFTRVDEVTTPAWNHINPLLWRGCTSNSD